MSEMQSSAAQALHAAIRAGDTSTVHQLATSSEAQNSQIYGGPTPLMLAAALGQVDYVSILLRAGADPSRRDRFGRDALVIAAQSAKWDVVITLVEGGVEVRSASGDEALRRAANAGRIHVVSALLRSGARADPEQISAVTPLCASARIGAVAVAELLLRHGADVNRPLPDSVPSGGGRTPLMIAAATGREQMVQLLLESGAALHVQDVEGFTALIHAAASGHVGVVEMLLQAGADPTVVSADGETAYSIAEHGDHQHVRQVLKRFLADPGETG